MWTSLELILIATFAVCYSAHAKAGTTILEDAEDGDTSRWLILDKKPKGAKVRVTYDKKKKSNVISLKGKGTKNRFRLRDSAGDPWHNESEFVFSWEHKYKKYFAIYLRVSTEHGDREIKYTPDSTPSSIEGNQIRHGLGKSARNGKWQHFEYNLPVPTSTNSMTPPGAK